MLVFFLRLVRQPVPGPNLPVRMGVRAAHHAAFVLENLDPLIVLPQFFALLTPDIDHVADVFDGHFRQGEVMAGRKTDHPASALDALVLEQGMARGLRRGRFGQESGKIIREYERRFVDRIASSSGAAVAGTEITIGVVRGARFGRGFFYLALPGPLHSVRRDKNPFSGQGIFASVGVLSGGEVHCQDMLI